MRTKHFPPSLSPSRQGREDMGRYRPGLIEKLLRKRLNFGVYSKKMRGGDIVKYLIGQVNHHVNISLMEVIK
jgi:hypothetical protein